MALRKEDPRLAPHPAHHVEEVLHSTPYSRTWHTGQEVTLLAHDVIDEVEKIIEIIFNFRLSLQFSFILYE